jgi:DNA-binding PucR family transcriptional regulator
MAELIGAIAARLATRLDDVVAEMDRAVVELVPAFGADAAIAAEVDASNRANLMRFMVVASRAEEPPPDVPPEALDIARTLARRGIELGAIFQAYRAGQQVAWQRWLEAAAEVIEPGPMFAAAIEESSELLFRYVDDVLSRVVAEAQHEREEILGGAHAQRAVTARLLLEDAPIDTETAGKRLGYDLSRPHTALVLWAEPPGVPQGALESAALLLSRSVGARRPFIMAAGSSTLWAWIAGEHEPSRTELREALADAAPEIRVAVGPTEAGVRGFRRSHEAALVVQRLVTGQQTSEQVATYAELEVIALTAGDEQRAAEFVAATLGPLAADESNAARLRETLRVYLDVADNAPRAAARLHTHRNTVLQRVARATELLGRDVGERRLALALALELAHRLGPKVLVRAER